MSTVTCERMEVSSSERWDARTKTERSDTVAAAALETHTRRRNTAAGLLSAPCCTCVPAVPAAASPAQGGPTLPRSESTACTSAMRFCIVDACRAWKAMSTETMPPTADEPSEETAAAACGDCLRIGTDAPVDVSAAGGAKDCSTAAVLAAAASSRAHSGLRNVPYGSDKCMCGWRWI